MKINMNSGTGKKVKINSLTYGDVFEYSELYKSSPCIILEDKTSTNGVKILELNTGFNAIIPEDTIVTFYPEAALISFFNIEGTNEKISNAILELNARCECAARKIGESLSKLSFTMPENLKDGKN